MLRLTREAVDWMASTPLGSDVALVVEAISEFDSAFGSVLVTPTDGQNVYFYLSSIEVSVP